MTDRAGKLRYFKGDRIEMFRWMAGLLRRDGEKSPLVYLCMEDRDVWELSLDIRSAATPLVSGLLDDRVNPL